MSPSGRRLQQITAGKLSASRTADLQLKCAALGWVTERLIVHAWKACVPKGTGGSNPPPSVPPFLLLLLLLLFLVNVSRSPAIRGDRSFLSLFCLTLCLGRFLNKGFYDAQQFVNRAYFFFDTALEHSDKSNTLRRKR